MCTMDISNLASWIKPRKEIVDVFCFIVNIDSSREDLILTMGGKYHQYDPGCLL